MNAPFSTMPEEIDNWVALRTSWHWEKQIAESLLRCRVPVYLPLLAKLQIYQSKRRMAEVPLFPGYVFCSELDFCGNRAVPAPLRNRIAQVMRPPDYEQLRRELIDVSNLLASRRLLQERLHGKPGDAIEVIAGSWVGHQGIVHRVKPNKRVVVVEISFIGARREVELDEDLVERI